ncbi:MAG: tetratricopeptide repeat protein [Acidobacteriota bacterium]
MSQVKILVAVLVMSAVHAFAAAPDEVQSIVDQGIVKHDQRDYAGAIELYRRALALDPNDPEANYELAYSLNASKQYDAALDQVMTALIKPGAVKVRLYEMSGTALDSQGRFAEGEAEFRKALAIDPNDANASFNLGICLVKQQKWLDAIAPFQLDLEYRPNHQAAWAGIAAAADEVGLRLQAILALLRYAAVTKDPSNAAGSTNRAWDLLMKGVTHSAGGSNITLNVDSDEFGADPSRGAANLMVGLLAAGRHLEEHKNQTNSEFMAESITKLANFAIEMADAHQSDEESAPPPPEFAADSFWRRHLYNYFSELGRLDLTQAMIFSLRAPLGEKGVAKWLKKNADKVEEWNDWQSRWKPTPPPQVASAPSPEPSVEGDATLSQAPD